MSSIETLNNPHPRSLSHNAGKGNLRHRVVPLSNGVTEQFRLPSPATRGRGRGWGASAFTLTELLIVIALSALLLALLFGPLVQGFRLTNRARAMVAAQDASRFGLEQLTRELRQASYIFDNTNTPMALPLEAPATAGGSTIPANNAVRQNTYQLDASGNAIVVPLEANGRLDFVPSAVRSDASDPTDPTTGRPLSGGQLRLPLAPGTRYVRYWIGLRRNYINNGGTISKAYYDNVYEFPRTDDSLNPFVLWRAEYDPTDPDLIDQTVAADDTTIDGGGINDPDFFYNTNRANSRNAAGIGGNGRTYAENWRAIANPIVNANNLDLISWRRNSRRQIDTTGPFQSGVNFSPSTIVGDAATPGFTTAAQAESPSAVPTLYTAQYGQWVLPFTVTVYRASATPNAGGGGRYGSVKLTFGTQVRKVNGKDVAFLTLATPVSTGTLALQPDDYYWMRSVSTGRIFVKLPNLSFWIDPARGRIETGLPPIAANPDGNHAPLFYPDQSRASVQAMQAGVTGNTGELAEMYFKQSTLHPSAGQAVPGTSPPQYIPLNQGILFADLGATAVQPTGTGFDRGNYYILNDTTTPRLSPFVTFGGAGNITSNRGAMLVPGSERVTGPNNVLYQVAGGTGTADPNLDPTAAARAGTNSFAPDIIYARLPWATTSVRRDAQIVDTAPEGVYVRRGNVTYHIERDLGNFNQPYLQFDDPNGYVPRRDEPADTNGIIQPLSPTALAQLGNPPGLPAGFANVATSGREINVTFLWQNNYARDTEGRPTNAAGQTQATQPSTPSQNIPPIRAEADVVKVDYSTRTLLNIGLQVRVYDSSGGQPQTAQVNDKVRVSNVGR